MSQTKKTQDEYKWLKDLFPECKAVHEPKTTLRLAAACWIVVAQNLTKDVSFFVTPACYTWLYYRYEGMASLYECNQLQKNHGPGLCMLTQHVTTGSGIPLNEVGYRNYQDMGPVDRAILAKFPANSFPCRIEFSGQCKAHSGVHNVIAPYIDMDDCQPLHLFDRVVVYKARFFYAIHTATVQVVPQPSKQCPSLSVSSSLSNKEQQQQAASNE